MVRESKDSSFSIICEGLAVGYSGKPLCNGFDLEINNGDYICIVGENGAGKSTFIKTLVGLIPAINGKVLLRGDIDKSDIGYLPQQREMQKDFPASVWEVVLSGCLDRLGFRPFYGIRSESLPLMLSESLTSRILRTRAFASFLAGSGSACSWHAPSPAPRKCWFWTSRSPGLTRWPLPICTIC